MKCVYCNSKRATLDLETNKCVCKKCRKEFADYVIKEPEDLNGFSLIVISILLQIPIISSIMLLFVCTGEVSYPYRKCVAYQYVGHIFIMFLMIYLLGLDIDIRQQEVISTLSNRASIINKELIDVEIEDKYVDNYYESLIIYKDKEEQQEAVEEIMLPEDIIDIDGIILDYNKTVDFIDSFTDYDYGVLLQTCAIRKKYGSNCFYNIGCIFNQENIEVSSTPIRYEYVNEDQLSLYYNGDKEVVKIDCTTVFKSKYVYSLKEDELYKIKFIYGIDDMVIGVILTALEE